jgi:hypothetical protein
VFIEAAVTAQSEEDALRYEQIAELMRAYSDRLSPILDVLSIEGIPMGYTESGALVAPLAADYAIWNAKALALAHAMTDARPSSLRVERMELVLSGAASPLARARFEALGIAVIERAFERLEGESARLSESPP